MKRIALFTQLRDCPLCDARESITIPTEAATFFRCKKCRQAIKRDRDGKLVAWLDVTRAGRHKRQKQ